MKMWVWIGAFSLVTGILILTGYSLYYTIFLLTEASTLIRIAVPALFFGIVILLCVVIVERFRTRKKESPEVREVKY